MHPRIGSRQARYLALVAALVLAACARAPGKPAPAGQAAAPPAAPQGTQEPELRIGIVTFLSGPAAGPFGVPARNAAELLIEQLNAGKVPGPYGAQKGIGGRPVRAVFVDEAGGADKQVAEFRRLALEEKVDLVVGYISSADCLAVAPVAEELKKLTVLFDCGTHRIFEEAQYRYVFRTAGHQVLDSVGAARYVLGLTPGARTIAGINQNYAWGQDSWNSFKSSMLKLKPDVAVSVEQFPKLFAGEYSAEISALLSAKPDVIHSSFWGGDLESFVIQAVPRGLHRQSTLVLVTGETILPRLGQDMPAGVVVGGRGTHGPFAPDNELNRWFKALYRDRYGTRPVYAAYHMAQAILGVKAAYEKALSGAGGAWPTAEQVIAAFEGAEFDTPSGVIRMALGGGHQAVEGAGFGVTSGYDASAREVALERVTVFPPECVNPPAGVASQAWIESGFQGSTCP